MSSLEQPPFTTTIQQGTLFSEPWKRWLLKVLNVVNRFDVAIWIVGAPTASEKILNLLFNRTIVFPAGLGTSVAKAITASTGTVVWNINKNSVNVGSITFTASTIGVFAMAAPQQFDKGDVMNIVAPVAQGGQEQPDAPQQEQQAEPQTIEKGQTADQVQAALGKPEKIVNLGPKQLYVYKDLKVTFVNGKVVDVQ